MDNPGWHAQRRAAHETDRFHKPRRGPDGQFESIEQVLPLPDDSIGGLAPPVPPKDFPPPSHRHKTTVDVPPTPLPLTQLSAVERSHALRSVRMQPQLQFMVGPLLRYDTVNSRGVWLGAALIVTADAGSIYEPYPMLTYGWDPEGSRKHHKSDGSRSTLASIRPSSFDLGPHPADPNSTVRVSTLEDRNERNATSKGPNAQSQSSVGQELYVYGNNRGTFTFWRFAIQIPLSALEMEIKYSINHGQQLSFHVPARDGNMRLAAYSCNGFSAGVNPDNFRTPGFSSGYDPVWVDLLSKHAETPFHLLVGGGDQLYCDGVIREPELHEWTSGSKPEAKKRYALTNDIALAIDRFYFNHYCKTFRSGAFARANSSIPMVNMCDDHDLIDGFGSYPDDLQNSPIFKTIGSRGYFFYLLFQCFIRVDVDGLNDAPDQHFFKSLILGGPGPYIGVPSHSFLTYLGPQTSMLMLDCRAERQKNQICSTIEYERVFERLWALPPTVEHLIVLVGVPIAYPRMVFLETTLGSKFNPLVALGRQGTIGLSNMVNKFNGEAELLDDLNDHWTAKDHKSERNWFIVELQRFAKEKRIRVTFMSGDVHCAAVGMLRTLVHGKMKEIAPRDDHRYMLNVVTSAIVNTPPPPAVITMVSSLATKVHKTLHHAETDEKMIPLFLKDTNDKPRKQKFIMGKRNWCSVHYDHTNGDMVFDIRVEMTKGGGQTVGYSVSVPKPAWS